MTERPVIVVTGAAKGIGELIALRAAGDGFRVIVADRDEGGGRAVAQEISTNGGSACFAAVDMGSVESVREMVDGIATSEGRIDALVNNAAVTRGLDFFEIDPEAWDEFFDINARGSFFAMQHAAHVMREAGGGSVVNVASIAGKGWPGTSNIAYASTKGAVLAMTRVAASQLGAFGIRVNAVCPGVTDTALMRDVLATRAQNGGPPVEDQRTALSSLASLGRITQPDDVAAAVMFLVSEGAVGITGQSVNVDSGIMWD